MRVSFKTWLNCVTLAAFIILVLPTTQAKTFATEEHTRFEEEQFEDVVDEKENKDSPAASSSPSFNQDPAGFCNSFTTCRSCDKKGKGHCGWCFSSDTCEPGDRTGPSNEASYYCGRHRWAFSSPRAPAQCPSCHKADTYFLCMSPRFKGCGWCGEKPNGPGECRAGDGEGPFFAEAECSDWSIGERYKPVKVTKQGDKEVEILDIEEKCPLYIIDDALKNSSLSTMESVFKPEDAAFWKAHEYRADPPSGFFSYVFPLEKAELFGPLGELALEAKRVAVEENILSGSPSVQTAERCRFAEVWAHNRPHEAGHQMHYDSDDEGKNGIRNPIVSSIFYLSDESVGGPTVITDRLQENARKEQTNNGWLCSPKVNRFTVFDGRVYHGVVSGKRYPAPRPDSPHQRRVTVMIAIWENIKQRDEKKWGAARPFPFVDDGVQRRGTEESSSEFEPGSNALKPEHAKWASELLSPPLPPSPAADHDDKEEDKEGNHHNPTPSKPRFLGHKWESFVRYQP